MSKEDRTKAIYAIEKKELYRDGHGKLRFNPPMPLDEFRAEAKLQLEKTLVSIKAKNKVVTRNINVIKKKTSTDKKNQLTPRGQLHQETIYGSMKQYVTKVEKVNATFDADKIKTISSKNFRDALMNRLNQFEGDPKKAFTGKNSLDNNPVWLNPQHSDKVPDKVKTVEFENVFTIRKEITPDIKIDKIVDKHIQDILQARLNEFNGDAKKAFANLEEDPIWLNKQKGIAIKRVTITGINNAEALHDKRDKDGNLILNEKGNRQPVDFVNTGNNHHVAIYRKPKTDKSGCSIIDENGNPPVELDEKIVSFYEATSRAMQHLPIIDKTYRQEDGWQFLFTMKQNEYFVFPRYDNDGNMVFNPKEYDEEWFKNPDNYSIISPNLFRVQKIATKNYFFRHHLETTVTEQKELKGITYKPQLGLNGISDNNGDTAIVKIRINHIGQIVSIGEY